MLGFGRGSMVVALDESDGIRTELDQRDRHWRLWR